MIGLPLLCWAMLTHSPAWAIQAPEFGTTLAYFTDAQGNSMQLPAQVTLKPFMAYEVGSGRPSVTKFEGSVVVGIQMYLVAVIVGEIANAGEINKLTEPNRGRAKAEAFYAQAQAALNCSLYRIAIGQVKIPATANTYLVPSGVPGKQGTFQTTALPMSYEQLRKDFGSVTVAAGLGGQTFDFFKYVRPLDPTFAIVLLAVQQRFAGLTQTPPKAHVATLGDQVPIDLPYFDVTTAGFTFDNNVVNGPFPTWQPHLRAQPSFEYDPSRIYGGTPGGDKRTGQVGMSQKGMIALAADGLSATRILDHYYHFVPPFVQGVEIIHVPKATVDALANATASPGISVGRKRMAMLFGARIKSQTVSGLTFDGRPFRLTTIGLDDPLEPVPDFVRVIRFWRREAVDPENPLATRRKYEPRVRGGISAGEGDLGVAVYFHERIMLQDGESLVKFTVSPAGSLLTVNDLSGTIFAFQHADEILNTRRESGAANFEYLVNRNKGSTVWFAVLNGEKVAEVFAGSRIQMTINGIHAVEPSLLLDGNPETMAVSSP